MERWLHGQMVQTSEYFFLMVQTSEYFLSISPTLFSLSLSNSLNTISSVPKRYVPTYFGRREYELYNFMIKQCINSTHHFIHDLYHYTTLLMMWSSLSTNTTYSTLIFFSYFTNHILKYVLNQIFLLFRDGGRTFFLCCYTWLYHFK